MNVKVAVYVKVRNSTFLKKNEERRHTFISNASNPIQAAKEHQFTKLPKQKNKVKDTKIDSVVQAHPD